MRRLLLLVPLITGCGLVGYDAQAVVVDGGEDAADADATTCTAGASADYCAGIPAMSEAPTLDGFVDCGLALQDFAPEGWYPTGAEPMPATLGTRFAAAYRPDGLYVYVEVDDAGLYPADVVSGLLYCGDSAEIYVDVDGTFGSPPSYDASGTRQFLARAPEGAGTSSIGEVFSQQVRIGTWSTSGFVVRPRTGGYALEAFLDDSDLGVGTWTLTQGATIGLDLGVNVSTSDGSPSECGTRIGQYFLRSASPGADPCFGRPYCDVTAFCTPTLLAP